MKYLWILVGVFTGIIFSTFLFVHAQEKTPFKPSKDIFYYINSSSTLKNIPTADCLYYAQEKSNQ